MHQRKHSGCQPYVTALVEIRKIFNGGAENFPILAGSMRPLICLIACVAFSCCYSQYLDLAKIEYTYLPGREANIEYQRQRVLFNIPFKVSEKAYFFAGLDYSNIYFEFKENQDSYDKTEAENFKSLGLSLSYIYELTNDWYVGIQASPSFVSNLEGSPIDDDLLVSGIIVFVKDKMDTEVVKKPHRIIAGIYYTSTSRFPGPFPFISYYRKFNPRWSYTIGAPASNLKYYVNEKHRIQLYAEGDGFNTHLQNGVLVNDELLADRVRMFLILAGFRYEYGISKHFEFYINVTRSVFSNVQLRDGIDVVFTPTIKNAMLYRIGIRCKI